MNFVRLMIGKITASDKMRIHDFARTWFRIQ